VRVEFSGLSAEDAAFYTQLWARHLDRIATALAGAAVTARYLPRSLPDEGALHSPVDSLENVAELGLGGVLPVFADEHFPGDAALDTDGANSAQAMTNVPEHPA
jgi:hypothetical protein